MFIECVSYRDQTHRLRNITLDNTEFDTCPCHLHVEVSSAELNNPLQILTCYQIIW